jgi:hypothetical protein
MTTPLKYFKELMLCDRLERQGLVNLIMPENNLLLSDKLVGTQRQVVIEALHTYVQAYYLTRYVTMGLAGLSATLGLMIIDRVLG